MTKRVGSLRMAPPHGGDPRRRAIKRQSIPEELAAALRERILTGEFREGSLLRQEALAEEYEVSRMPVREALRLLEGEGLVALQTHRGAVVRAHSPDQIGELFDLRALLERDLIVRAVPRARPEDLARTEAIFRRLESAYTEKDPHAWGALNSEYHRSLYLPSAREYTLALVQTINGLTERYIRLYLRLTTAFAQARTDHREMLRLYRAGKAEEAGELVERHVLHTKDALVGALEARHASQK